MVFTKQIAEIDKVYYGSLNVGDKIEILQTGGVYENIETSPIMEAPLLDKKGEYLLFLRYTKEGHYLILGGYQGVGLIHMNKIKFNEANSKMSKELKDKSMTKLEELINKIIAAN